MHVTHESGPAAGVVAADPGGAADHCESLRRGFACLQEATKALGQCNRQEAQEARKLVVEAFACFLAGFEAGEG